MQEVEALASAAIEGEHQALDRALYVTAAMTGLRQGELLALRWSDMDWAAQRVRVRRSYVLGAFDTPKSRRSSRSVPMSMRVARELDRWQQATRGGADDALVFAGPATGDVLRRGALMRRYRRALKAAKLEPTRRFHDLRHTFGTAMAAAGVPMRTLQEWMGHRDLRPRASTRITCRTRRGRDGRSGVRGPGGRPRSHSGSQFERICGTSEQVSPANTGDIA